jgi:anti-anti-sigma factor
MALTVEVAMENGAAVLKLVGSLDASSTEYLSNAISQAAQKTGTPRIVLSMDSLEFISSAGWSLLVESSKELKEKNGDLRLSEMRETALRIFKLMGLEVCLKEYRTQIDAVKSYAE